ncbi:PaaI family thioesterase [Streptomyces sp. ISL-96]|nr:PaaI family thioesterase [Streptomyces sp. ISL-96]
MHGGVLAYAADNALTFAGGAALGPAVPTGGFSIQYVRPATGATLIARAVVVHGGHRQAVCRCDLAAPAALTSGRRSCPARDPSSGDLRPRGHRPAGSSGR